MYSISDVYSLINCLHGLQPKPEDVIIIDSITAPYLSFVGSSNNEGKSLKILSLLKMSYLNFIYRFILHKSYFFSSSKFDQKKCYNNNHQFGSETW